MMRGTWAFLPLLVASCGPTGSGHPPRDLEDHSLAILETVFRYELKQFVETPQEPAGTVVCLGIADGQHIADPPEDLVARLAGGSGFLPESRCNGIVTVRLSAGPIERVSSTEVRVKGGFRLSTAASSAPLVYRVVWEGGDWHCLGPILGYDPL